MVKIINVYSIELNIISRKQHCHVFGQMPYNNQKFIKLYTQHIILARENLETPLNNITL
jgi:hypothetical protein